MKPSVVPQDWPRLFTERLNAGDLEGVAALYEPDACFVTPSGETLVGREKIRSVVAGLIEAKTRMQCRVVRAVTANEVAVLYTDFDEAFVGSQDRSGPPAPENRR